MRARAQRRRKETDAEFVARVARTRGRLERRFWDRAQRLKAALARCESLASGIGEQVQLALARAAVRSANRTYLNEDLELALRKQEGASRILRRLEASTD